MGTISVTGKAEVFAPSDITELYFDINGVEPTYGEAVSKLARCTGQVKDIVEEVGFERSLVKSTTYVVKPHTKKVPIKNEEDEDDDAVDFSYDCKFKYVEDGFSYSTKLSMEFPNDNKVLAQIIDSVMHTDLTPKINFEFKSSDYEGMKRRAMIEAVKNAKAEAEAILDAAGAKLGPIESISHKCNRDSYAPMEVNFNARLASCNDIALDIDPSDDYVEDTVLITWEILQ